MVAQNQKPVFLHGMWRCGSTYVWSKFRELENTYCFYEPLHHGLARTTEERIGRDAPSARQVDLSHPDMKTSPYAEFIPLIKRRGVPGLKASYAFDRFALAGSEDHSGLKRYIDGLTGYAQELGQVPVLGFNRTIYRMEWMKNNFDGWHMHIDRDPVELWASYMRHQQKGNYTFFGQWLYILECNQRYPFFAPMAKRYTLRRGLQKIQKRKPFYKSVLKDLPAGESYALVFYFWLGAAVHALSYADCILDMNQTDDTYRKNTEDAIFSAVNLDVQFDDLDVRSKMPEGIEIDCGAIEAEVFEHFDLSGLGILLNKGSVEKNLPIMNNRKASLVQNALSKL